MTHDEFVSALGDAPSWAGSCPALPAEAQAHARDCADCRRLLEALSSAALEESALADAVPPDYWARFGARLMARLQRERPSGAPTQGLGNARIWLRIAAGIVFGALVLIAWRAPREVAGELADTAATHEVPVSDLLAAMRPEEVEDAVEDALAAFDASGLDPISPGDVLALDALSADPGAADALLPAGSADLDEVGGSVESLEADLLENLSASDQQELVRLLEEASS